MNTADTLTTLAQHLPLLTPNPTGTSSSDGQPRPTTTTPKPPIRLDVVDLMAEIRHQWSSWIQVVFGLDGGENSRVWVDPPVSLAGQAWWLLPWSDTLVADPQLGADWMATVDGLWRRVMPLVGARLDRVPNCPGCGWRLSGRGANDAPAESVADWRWAVCTGCGHRWTFDAGLKRLGVSTTVTLWEFAAEQQIPLATLRRHAHARHLPVVGILAGRNLYQRSDLDALLGETPAGASA